MNVFIIKLSMQKRNESRMMRSRRLHAQKKVLFWLGSSWRKKILPKPVSNAIWKRANDVLSCEEHERQISSDTSPFEQNIKIPNGCRVRMGGLWLVELFPSSLSDTLLKQLDKSGWDGVHAYALNRNPNSEKAREARTKENIGWWRLGHDVDKGFRGFAPNAVFLDLPHGFESVEYNAIQIGSSLTVISAFFSPTEEMRTKLDAEWHAEHEPILLAFEFNVFSATLGCSRMHRFVYSKGRTRDELLSCWLAAISFYGGVPEEWMTDNMSAIVTFDGRRRVKSDRVLRFAREAGFELCLCKLSYLSSGVWASRLLQLMPTFIGDKPTSKSCL